MMGIEEIRTRKWAIERAIAADLSCYPEIVEAASAFVDFVNGTNDAEVLSAARELAGKVTLGKD